LNPELFRLKANNLGQRKIYKIAIVILANFSKDRKIGHNSLNREIQLLCQTPTLEI
jgi:hypothetical protein